MGMTNGNTTGAPQQPAAPAQPAMNPWLKVLKGGLQGTVQGLKNYGQQPQQSQKFYGQ